MKVAVAIACAAVLALAVQGSFAATHRSTLPPTPAPCATSGLVVWLNTQGSGAAGSIFYKLEFTNLSGHRCTLRGYPGVSAVNLHGHKLGSPAARGTATPHRVTLSKGGTRTATLQIVEVGNFTPSACHPVTAAGLRVFPPNQTKSKVVPFPFGACSKSGLVYMRVKAVH